MLVLLNPLRDLMHTEPLPVKCLALVENVDVTMRRYSLRPPAAAPARAPAPPAPPKPLPPWLHDRMDALSRLAVTAAVRVIRVRAVMEATPPTAMTMDDTTPGVEVRCAGPDGFAESGSGNRNGLAVAL